MKPFDWKIISSPATAFLRRGRTAFCLPSVSDCVKNPVCDTGCQQGKLL